MLTAAQQDYIEIIYRLEKKMGRGNVRISDIAGELGTRLPTVTRTVKRLTELEYLNHASRKAVSLTPRGETIAIEILHRHTDLVRFFVEILGLPNEQAETDAGQVEHGISGSTAQRLHEFLQFVGQLQPSERAPLDRFLSTVSGGEGEFSNLPSNKTEGWRT